MRNRLERGIDWGEAQNSEQQKLEVGFRLQKGSGKRLARRQRYTTGKHIHFEFKMPYPHLDALSVTLQKVDDAPHPLPAILSVETRH